MNLKVENNRYLFYILAGLVSSGADAYDHDDVDISALADRIGEVDISDDVKAWFARARTGQVEVNPYWPRVSALAAACFFVGNGNFDIDAFFTFFESAAVSDPIGTEDFRAWISGLPKVKSIGTEHIYLWTSGFINPKFYEKHGYKVFTVFEDFFEAEGYHHIGYRKDF